MGVIEAFGHAEENGHVLTFAEKLFLADARQRKGCRMQQGSLTEDEIKKIIEIGRRCEAAGGKK